MRCTPCETLDTLKDLPQSSCPLPNIASSRQNVKPTLTRHRERPAFVAAPYRLLCVIHRGSPQSVVRYASIAGLEFSLSLLHAVLPRNIRPQLELIIQVSRGDSSTVQPASAVLPSLVNGTLFCLEPRNFTRVMRWKRSKVCMSNRKNTLSLLPSTSFSTGHFLGRLQVLALHWTLD